MRGRALEETDRGKGATAALSGASFQDRHGCDPGHSELLQDREITGDPFPV
jgi:hypothetical protein